MEMVLLPPLEGTGFQDSIHIWSVGLAYQVIRGFDSQKAPEGVSA